MIFYLHVCRPGGEDAVGGILKGEAFLYIQ